MSRLVSLLKPSKTGKWTQGAARAWLDSHHIEFMSFVQTTYDHYSIPDAIEKFYNEDPFLGVEKTLDFNTPNRIKIKILKQLLQKLEFGQILFLGQQQSGKTVMMFVVAHWYHQMGRKVAWLGPPAELPSWVSLKTIDYYQIPAEWVIIYDEGAVRHSHRDAMTKESREFFQNLPTISHNDQILLFSSQSSRITDVMNTILFQMLISKRMTGAQLKTERPIIKDLSDWIPQTTDKEITYIKMETDPFIQFTVSVPLPIWWQKEFSKLYRRFNSDEEAIEYARQLFEIMEGQPDIIRRIAKELKRMRFDRSENFWRDTLGVENS